MKYLKSIVLAFFVLAATTNNVFTQSTTQNSDTTKTITIKVKGITCSMDLKTIATNVEELKGVSSSEPGKMGATSTFEVKYNPALVTEKEIHSAIENTGGCKNSKDRPYKVKQ